MTTAEMIKQLCEQMNICIAELARRIGQTPQNFNKKLKRETVSLHELKAIADVLKRLLGAILKHIRMHNSWGIVMARLSQ